MSRPIYRACAALLAAMAINGCSDTSGPVTRPSTSLSAAATTYSGRAYAVQATIPALAVNQRVADMGPLPSGGGKLSNAVVAFVIPNALQFELLSTSTSGKDGVAKSQAKVQRTKIFAGPNVILVEILQSNTRAQCVNGQPVLSGQTVIVGLLINGQGVVVTGQPNQVVPLPGGGTVTINEQTQTSNSITVRALHVRVPRVMEVIVSHSYSDINC